MWQRLVHRHLRSAKLEQSTAPPKKLWLELNHYNEEDEAEIGFQIYNESVSVYVQSVNTKTEGKEQAQVETTKGKSQGPRYWKDGKSLREHDTQEFTEVLTCKKGPRFSVDDGDTMIVFSTAFKGSLQDIMIGARKEREERWRRLPSYLEDTHTDVDTASHCEIHVGILENRGRYRSRKRKFRGLTSDNYSLQKPSR